MGWIVLPAAAPAIATGLVLATAQAAKRGDAAQAAGMACLNRIYNRTPLPKGVGAAGGISSATRLSANA
ncbi:MAG: hypothetical protein AAGG51_09860 [Cyanobacteria bacterium P01_G01_bin.54]